MTTLFNPKITIIGAGKLGLALAGCLHKAGHKVAIISRNVATAKDRLAKVDFALPLFDYQHNLADTDICLLCVPDQAVHAVSKKIAPQLPANSILAHCSGVLNSAVLAHESNRPYFICSVHPLNTFPTVKVAVNTLQQSNHNTWLYCEGEKEALTTIQAVFSAMGFHFAELDTDKKPLYHAACVMVCNYLTVLMDAGLSSAEAAGLSKNDFWQSIQPLIHSTLHNIGTNGTTNALSGPIARGDVATIASHLQSLETSAKSLADMYRNLGHHALQLARKTGNLDEQTITDIEHLLTTPIKSPDDNH